MIPTSPKMYEKMGMTVPAAIAQSVPMHIKTISVVSANRNIWKKPTLFSGAGAASLGFSAGIRGYSSVF